MTSKMHHIPYLFMMVGLPGSGKSTEIKNIVENIRRDRYLGTPYVVLSTDAYIEAKAEAVGKTYGESFQEHIKDAEAHLNLDLEMAINATPIQKDIFWDQTNLSVKNRKKKLDRIPRNYVRIAIVFDIPAADLQTQLDNRYMESGKFIPRKVVDEMRATFQYPTYEEGFEDIISINAPFCERIKSEHQH